MAQTVNEVYEQLLKSGYTAKDAAKEAQARTGASVVTGRPISQNLKFTSKGVTYGNRTIKYKFGQYGD